MKEEVSEDNLQFIKHDVATPFLHDFMGFSAFSVSTLSNDGMVEVTITTYARLDVSVFNIITCHCVNSSMKIGSHRHKFCSETFLDLIPITFPQLTHQIGAYDEG